MNLNRFLKLPDARTSEPSDQRDPKAATLRVNYGAVGLPMPVEWDAESAFRYAYLANVITWRCVQIRAQAAASCPFRAGKDPKKPMDFNDNAPLAQLLGEAPGGPNPETAAEDFFFNYFAQKYVTGRFGAEIELDKSDRPVALWPLAAQHLKAIPTESGNKYFKSFFYGQPGNGRSLKESEVYYDWRPALHDYRQPESVLQAARLDISIAVMQDRYDYAFLKNDAKPATLMVVQSFAEREEFAAFKDQINAEYGGPDNAGKTMVTESEGNADGGVKDSVLVQSLGISQKDAEFIKRHELKYRNIAIALGVPWSLLDASGRTFDNADKEYETFWRLTVLPDIRQIQNRINIKLAPRLGSEIGWFDISGVEVLQPPKRFSQVSVSEAYQVGLIGLDEGRSELGRGPAADEAPELLDKPEPVNLDIKVDGPTDTKEVERVARKELKKVIEAAKTNRSKPEVREIDHDIRRTKILKKVDKQARLREARWENKFKKLFARQEKAVIDRLEGKRGRQAIEKRDATDPAEALFDKEFWARETVDMTEDMYADLYELGAQRILDNFLRSKRDAIDALELDFSLDAPFVQEFIHGHANRLSGQVSETTFNAIKDALAKGVAEGEGIPELSKRVKDVFDIASTSRAEMIARTEVLSGYNAAANLTAAQLPADVVGGKEWIGEGWNGDECEGYNGTVVAVGDGWDGMDAPPAHPNCRCTVAFLTPDEMNSYGFSPRRKMIEIRLARRIIETVGKAA